MIHGIFCTHVMVDKENVGCANVCIGRFRRHIKAVVFMPYLPDRFIYYITSEMLIEITHNATTAAEAAHIIWRSQPADGLERPT